MERIKEGFCGVYNLFFTAIKETDGGELVAFLKEKPGNSIAEGFAFEVPFFEKWEQVESFFLQPEMAPFWLERDGFHLEKYFYKIAYFWAHVPGAPDIKPFGMTGRLRLPDFQARLFSAFD